MRTESGLQVIGYAAETAASDIGQTAAVTYVGSEPHERILDGRIPVYVVVSLELSASDSHILVKDYPLPKLELGRQAVQRGKDVTESLE